MSYPVLLTADKAEFINFLSDNIDIKKDSDIALTKATLSIPVVVQEECLIPLVEAGDQDDNALSLVLDGIEIFITWTEIHTSYTILNTANGIEGNIDIDDFYSGTYFVPLNNFIEFINGAGLVKSRPNICNILAHAFGNQLFYYNIESTPKLTPSTPTKISQRGGVSVTFNGANYTTTPMQNVSMELGFRALYNPNKSKLQNTRVPMNDGSNLQWESVANYTVDNTAAEGASLLSNAGAGAGLVNVACCDKIAGKIDPNGGHFSFKVSNMGAAPAGTDTNIMIVGLTQGLDDGVNIVPTAGLDFDSYICGIKFIQTATDLTIQILDVDGELEPRTTFNTFNVDDYFFIRLARSTDAGVQRTYNFSVWKSGADLWDNNCILLYQSPIQLSSPLDYYMTVSSDRTNMEIKDCKCVPITLDSKQQFDTNLDTNLQDNTMFQYDTMNMRAVATNDNDIKSFFQELGIEYLTNQLNPVISSVAGNGYVYNYVIPRIPERVFFYIGARRFSDLYIQSLIGATPVLQLNISASSSEIPRMLELTIKDLNNTTYQASNIGGGGSVENSNAITRVVGTILVPQEYITKTSSFDMNISYEPYNLIYRKLYNRNNIPVNQFNCKLGYKDFSTNQERIIRNMNGVSKYEIHIKECGGMRMEEY